MFERIIQFAIEQRWLVLLAVLGMAGVGIGSYQKLSIDAVPDITNVQVQINTAAPGYSPLEVEQRITYPVETVMAGLPGLQETRSLSRPGISQVTVIFEEGTDIYFARQQVNERLSTAREQLPEDISPTLGPISTGLGEIYLWTVEAEEGATEEDGSAYTPTDLRTIQDWIIRPQLRNVKGVAEINTIGGYAKQFLIAPDPKKLAAYKLTLGDLQNASAAQQRERRRRLHRAARRAVADPRAGPGQGHGRYPRDHRFQRRRRADPYPRRRRGRPGQGAAHRRGHRERPRSGARHGVHADRREQPGSGPGGRPAPGGDQPDPAQGGQGDHRLRPHHPGGQGRGHGEEEPGGRRGAGDRGALPVPRQHPRGVDHRHHHPAVDAVHLHRDGRQQGQCQPDEPRRAGLRHHRRRRRGDRRERHPPPGPRPGPPRPPADPRGTFPRGLRRVQGGAPGAGLRPDHHHGGVPADLRPSPGWRGRCSTRWRSLWSPRCSAR